LVIDIDASIVECHSEKENAAATWKKTGVDLIAWTQMLLLDREMAQTGPKKLRYRLLHTAARIVHTGRRTLLRINASWPWAHTVAQAFQRLQQLPRPAI
jgi:Transposase DDE domain group 1